MKIYELLLNEGSIKWNFLSIKSATPFTEDDIDAVQSMSNEEGSPNNIAFMIRDVKLKGKNLKIELEWNDPITVKDGERILKKVAKQLKRSDLSIVEIGSAAQR
jgi:hypothetical protein